MLSQDTFKNLLIFLQFKEEEKDIFTKKFQNDVYIKADFEKKILIYPEDKGFTINERQTCNFSSAENFVVFECVHRLFEKGYKPEHIELEPKWKLGHGASGGRADILVKSQEKDEKGEYRPLLLIECKTAGNEFTKAWKYMLLDGGQLFSYAQQIQEVQFLCLYASTFDEKTKKISIEQKIVSHQDNTKILVEDAKLQSFENAKNVKERYEVWKNTYKLESTVTGIFEENIPPYTIGKNKHTLRDLTIIGETDIQKKYHEFAEILRKYNISGRENAFDKLVNLFLAKIVDEKHNPYFLQCRWNGIANDNYFDFLDRLEELYANGMKEFLKEEVTFVKKEDVINAFKFFRNDPNSTVQAVLGHFKKQKYFTNNDFSFIDVHNEKLFYQNMVVLKQMVEMIQEIQLNGDQQNQFLGDLFEGFLDKGVKQTEGQFFTPMPIVKFIVASLPLKNIIQESKYIPYIIDYACGAGHFLTEIAAQIKPLINTDHINVNHKDYFRNIYGIEKEYRLSKVAKVSAFMYSQDEIQVFYADALTAHPEIKDKTFDILVANPPFAVKGFLETLDEEQRKRFDLAKDMDDFAKNNAIQCFFLERANQLLSINGIAGIIVPTSVLSNSDKIHTNTRTMLIENFDIIALVELGSGTFSKTGTNTVILFLRKKDNNPKPSMHFKERVNNWFGDNDKEKQTIFNDFHYIKKYCQAQNFEYTHYQTLLTAFDDLNVIKNLLEYDIFKEYIQEINKKVLPDLKIKHKKQKEKITKQLQKQEPTINANEYNQQLGQLAQEQQKEIEKLTIQYIKDTEKEKLYFFTLAHSNPQKVLVIKSPQDTKEQKQFLGYEWSGSKGNEGIKYINQNIDTNIDDEDNITPKTQALRIINTPMFDNNDNENKEKLNYYIQQNFLLEKKYFIDENNNICRDFLNEYKHPLPLPEHLQTYANYANLIDLLDFSRKDFNKAISLNLKKKINIESKWELVKLGDVAEILIGGTPSRDVQRYFQGDNLWVSIAEMSGQIIINTKEKISDEGVQKSNVKLIPKGTTLLSFKLSIGKTAIAGADLYTNEAIAGLIPKNKNIISDSYLFQLFTAKLIDLSTTNNVIGQSLNSKYLRDELKIPLPPLEIQEKIVLECEAIDKATENAKNEIEKAKNEIEEKVKEVLGMTKDELKLGQLAETSSGGTPLSTKNEYYQNGTIPWINSGEVGQGEILKAKNFITELGLQNSSAKMFPKNTVLLAMYGATAGKVGILKIEACTNQAVCGIFPNEKYLPKFLYLQLYTMYDYLLSLRTGVARDNLSQSKIQEIKIKLPPLEIQEKLVSHVEILEKIILENREIIDGASQAKQEIIKKYL